MLKTAIDVKNVRKTYKSTKALSGLNFKIKRATCFGLLGPNGAGKSTMMKILYGMTDRDRNNDDTVTVFGYDPKTDPLKIKFLSGIVPQEDNLDVELTVEQNLKIYSRFYGLDKDSANQRINTLLDFMELSDRRKARIKELSGGMKRRLTIARALINNPELLILDEPTTGLDPQVRHHIWHKIRDLKKQGVTILLTTHYMDEAFQLCDDLIIMHKGKAMLQGAPSDLINANIEPYVLEIFNSGPGCVKETEGIRAESYHGNLYLFSESLEKLKEIASTCTSGEHYMRQTNLEDLFLKITGRRLHG